MTSIFFILRLIAVWAAAVGLAFGIIEDVTDDRFPDWIGVLAILGTIALVGTRAFSHVRRVRLITDRVDGTALANRHRRRIEIPFPAEEAFAIVDAAIRELPRVEKAESARDSLQVRARVKRPDPYVGADRAFRNPRAEARARRNLVHTTIVPGDGIGTLTLICEPEGGGWLDWFLVDDGTNLENMEGITRAITRRIAEKRKGEEAHVRGTAADKELAVAKLSLLHAQVEPHFLYNTLASAQILARNDPPRADQMLGHLITYLRQSMPRAEDSMSTLGEELQRARAYLEILKLRMGERLALEIQVPAALERVPMPPMMLQTLVENAIKHGLEPMTGGGTVWILAREDQGRVAVTVADDGRGFGTETSGTGIGLKNVRERLRLAYGDAASFSIGANFPRGVAATVTLPMEPPVHVQDARAMPAPPAPPAPPSPPPRDGTPPWEWQR